MRRELDGSVGDDPGHGGRVAAPQPEEAFILVRTKFMCPMLSPSLASVAKEDDPMG